MQAPDHPRPRRTGAPRRPRSRAATITIASALATLLAPHAQALQLVEASDGVSVEAIVSSREPTRIRIEGAPITDVVGNIHSSRCESSPPALPLPAGSPTPIPALPAAPLTNAGGDVVIECQRDKGEIFIRPVGEGTRPINLFVSSATATYTLVLRRSDIPAETIVIRDRSRTAARARPAASGPASPATHHVRALKALLLAMATDQLPDDLRVEEVQRPVRLWAEASLLQLRRYEGRGLVGEKYLLHNTSTEPMVLAEAEFDREGGDVAGIAIEHHNLRPGESTSVYVIRTGVTP